MESILGNALTFLKIDLKEMPMSIGRLYLFQTTYQSQPTPTLKGIRALIEANIAHYPSLRQRIIEPLFNIANPIWLEDPHFDIKYHVNQLEVGHPHNWQAVLDTVSDITTERLDRGSPLWKLYFIPLDFIPLDSANNLGTDYFAFYYVTHKALEFRMDHSILDLLTRFNPQPKETLSHNVSINKSQDRKVSLSLVNYLPEAIPSRNELLSKAKDDIFNIPKQLGKITKRIAYFITKKTIADQVTPEHESPPKWFSAPKSLFNRCFGPDRIYGSLFWPAEELDQLSRHFKDTANADILLLITTIALKEYLHEQGQLPSQPLIALSVLNRNEGKKLAHYLVRLPTTTSEPMKALRIIRQQRKQLDAYYKIASPASMLSQLPPRLISAWSRSYIAGRIHRFHPPVFNICLTYHEHSLALNENKHWKLSNEAHYGELYPGIGLHLNFVVNKNQVSINYTAGAANFHEEKFGQSFSEAKKKVEHLIERQPVDINSAKSKAGAEQNSKEQTNTPEDQGQISARS